MTYLKTSPSCKIFLPHFHLFGHKTLEKNWMSSRFFDGNTDLNQPHWTPNTWCPSSFVLDTTSVPSGGLRRPVVGIICSVRPTVGFNFLCNILWPLCCNARCLNAERVAPPGESLERTKAQLKFGWRNELLRITSSAGGAGVLQPPGFI